MSDLQLALLLVSIFFVVAVLIFNWNQERRFKKQVTAAFESPTRDALRERVSTPDEARERVEPRLRESVSNDPAPPVNDALHEPGLGARPLPVAEAKPPAPLHPAAVPKPSVPHPAASPNPLAPLHPAAAPNPGGLHAVPKPAPVVRPLPIIPPKPALPPVTAIPAAPYDELIEYRVRIEGENILAAVFAEDINRARNLGKPTRWVGFPEKGTAWEEVQAWREAFYREVQVTVQLADRNGAILQDELTGLCALLQTTAQTHGLNIVCDDAAEAIQRAQSIDHFCVDVDVLIGLNVVARGEGVMKLVKVLKEVEPTGMVLGVDGAYRLLDSRGEPLYSLCNHDGEPFSHAGSQQETQAVTLQFDVPRVPDGLKVFDGMVSFGRKLANEVGGLLVDDNMRPLTDSGIDKIRQQLAGIYQRMEARGVPSGSRRALQLFS